MQLGMLWCNSLKLKIYYTKVFPIEQEIEVNRENQYKNN